MYAYRMQKFKAPKIEEAIQGIQEWTENYNSLILNRKIGRFIFESIERTPYRERLKTDSDVRRAKYQFLMGLILSSTKNLHGVLVNFLRGIDKGDYKCIVRSLPNKWFDVLIRLSRDSESVKILEGIKQGKKI